MTAPADLLKHRLNQWAPLYGAPCAVALVKHSERTLARFHPLASYERWRRDFEAVRAELVTRGIAIAEVSADDAPASVQTGEHLARWAEAQLPIHKGDPYRLGISLSHSGGRRGQPATGEIGWWTLLLGVREGGVDR